MKRRCVAILGGSFDPVHNGHVALGAYFYRVLQADELRIIPTGNPWQKACLQASPQDRVAMVIRAFEDQDLRIKIDRQEILRQGPTYTIDTLRALRTEQGSEASIAFLIGADQLGHLESWNSWQDIFQYAHVCAASRPGFATDGDEISASVSNVFTRRAGSPEQIRATPAGYGYLSSALALDISATTIRAAIAHDQRPEKLVPPAVLDYIEQHHLYKS